MASELPKEKRNAVLGRLWPKCKTQGFGGDITPQENSRKIIRKPNEVGCE